MSFQDTSKFNAGFADDECLCGWPDLPGRCPGPGSCPMHGQNEPPEDEAAGLCLHDQKDDATIDRYSVFEGGAVLFMFNAVSLTAQEVFRTFKDGRHAESDRMHQVLTDLVAVTKDDLLKLPEGYRARLAIDRAIAALNIQERASE